MLRTSFAKISETNQPNVFAYEHYPDDVQLGSSHGRLFVLLVLKKPKEEVISPLEEARSIYSTVLESYYSANDKPFSAIKSTLAGTLEKHGAGLNIAIACFVGGVFYTAVNGNLSAYLLRDGALVQILTGANETVSASGYPKSGDTFFIGSKDFFETYAAKLPSVFDRESFGESAALFQKLVGEDQYSMAVGFFEEGTALKIDPVAAEVENDIEELPIIEKPPIEIGEDKQLGLVSKFKSKFLKRKSEQLKVSQVFETVEEAKKKRSTLLVAVILLTLLVVSIGFGFYQKSEREVRERYEDRLVQAQHDFEEAENLAGLNPSRSRELFIQAKTTIEALVAEGVEDERLANLANQILQKEGKILGEYNVQPTLFVDLSLIGDNMEAVDMAGAGEDFVVFDTDGERVIRISFADKNTRVIAGPAQVGGGRLLAYYSPNGYLVKDDEIYSVGSASSEIAEVAGAKLLYAYAANLYALTSTSEIFRLSNTGSGFATPASWLAADQDLDLGGAVSWAIDGNMWIITKAGNIIKLTQGTRENFSYSTPFEIKEPRAIYTNEEAENLYVLDNLGMRIVVLDKEGNFLAQYKSESLADAKDIVVSEDDRLLVFLTPDKTYSINLEHLE